MSRCNAALYDIAVLFRLCLTLGLLGSLSARTSIAQSAKIGSPSVEDVLDAWDKGCAAIRSYDVFLRGENQALLDPTKDWSPRKTPLEYSGQSHEIFRLGKRRVEPDIRRPGEPAALFAIWDGELAKRYSSASNELLVGSDLTSVLDVGAPGGMVDYETWYRTLGGRLSFADIFRQRPETTLESKEASKCILFTPPCRPWPV